MDETLSFLLNDAYQQAGSPHSPHAHSRREEIRHYEKHVDHLEASSKLRILHELLCVRPPEPPLPEDVLQRLDAALATQRSHRMLTRADSLTPLATANKVSISLWRGDITALANVSAVTNAANGQMLGCFQPTHRCIDNVIHEHAGPRLRAECHELMRARGDDLKPGEAVVTKGHALPAPYVVHTVGPQLFRGRQPERGDEEALAWCYEAVLDAVQGLPVDGGKSVALCCISTGLFAFPAEQAAQIAVNTVAKWLEENPSTTITHIIFNTFTESDAQIYKTIFASPPPSWTPNVETPTPPILRADTIRLARQWLDSADAVLVTAGAGLSAATGLDYLSPTLFAQHFPGMLRHGLRTLYSVFGFSAWPSEQHRWGYYFTHLHLVKEWPASPVYGRLLAFLQRFGEDAHVRTSNADGFFAANGWDTEKLSTPQGQYAVLQCTLNCRPDAVVDSWPLVEDGMASVDAATQKLTDASKVPRCRFCGGSMFICVRADATFNQHPFKRGEAAWDAFATRVLREKKRLVVLELGVGMNTPGVLRWPNEDMVAEGEGSVRLVRAGMGREVAVPFELEDKGWATSIEGDLKDTISQLFE